MRTERPEPHAPKRRLARMLRGRARTLCDGEDGAMNALLCGMIVLLLAVGMVVIITLGDAVADRRSANSAADAAALAAADYCADRLEDAYRAAVEAPDDESFWAQFGKPVSSYCSGAFEQARAYARSNGATLTDFTRLSGNRFRASVTNDGQVAGTDLHNGSTATARLTFTSGVCVRNGLLGVEDGLGTCRTSPGNGGGRGRGAKGGATAPARPSRYPATAVVDTELVAG